MTKEDNYFYQIILILGRKFIKSKKMLLLLIFFMNTIKIIVIVDDITDYKNKTPFLATLSLFTTELFFLNSDLVGL